LSDVARLLFWQASEADRRVAPRAVIQCLVTLTIKMPKKCVLLTPGDTLGWRKRMAESLVSLGMSPLLGYLPTK